MRASALILFFIAVAARTTVVACQCPPESSFSRETLAGYDAIFSGHIDSVTACDNKGWATAYFTVRTLFRGSLRRTCKVTFECASDCMVNMQKGEDWLVYGNFQRFDVVQVNFCGNNRRDHGRDPDPNAVVYGRTFADELQLLEQFFGTIMTVEEQPAGRDLGPTNTQPDPLSKMLLLSISVGVMAGIFVYIKWRDK